MVSPIFSCDWPGGGPGVGVGTGLAVKQNRKGVQPLTGVIGVVATGVWVGSGRWGDRSPRAEPTRPH